MDKFREHVKTHKNPEKFLCIIETCRTGPLTRAQLVEHLGMQHLSDYSRQPQVGDYIAALPFLSTKIDFFNQRRPDTDIIGKNHEYSLFHVFEKRSEGKDACPIRGCDFRLSLDQPVMEYHIDNHDLMDRMKSHKDIERVCPKYDYLWSRFICPMCQEEVSAGWQYFHALPPHFDTRHSKEERLASPNMLEFCRVAAAVPDASTCLYFGEIIHEARC